MIEYYITSVDMEYTVTQESFYSLNSYLVDSNYSLGWDPIFVLPQWLETWWQAFGSGSELYLVAVRQESQVIGIAPLLIKENTATIIGSSDVCDYLDFIVVPDAERRFFTALLDNLKQRNISQLDLRALRPDSTALTYLVDIARNEGGEVASQPEDVSLELELPLTWEEYLAALASKQRHEVRRKLRRLSKAGKVNYYFVEDSSAVPDVMDTFLKMFSESREDKATFLTTQMEAFFRSLAYSMAKAGLLKLGVLELDALPVAIVMCFDYNDCVYLYNSGYNPRYSSLSVGLLSKILCIQESIRRGKKKFDFLKGRENYKYQLGGREVPIYRCQITIV